MQTLSRSRSRGGCSSRTGAEMASAGVMRTGGLASLEGGVGFLILPLLSRWGLKAQRSYRSCLQGSGFRRVGWVQDLCLPPIPQTHTTQGPPWASLAQSSPSILSVLEKDLLLARQWCSTLRRQRRVDFCEFEASLFRVSSWTARQRELLHREMIFLV